MAALLLIPGVDLSVKKGSPGTTIRLGLIVERVRTVAGARKSYTFSSGALAPEIATPASGRAGSGREGGST